MNILSALEREEFLKLQRSLILFTNQKHNIYKDFKTVEDLEDISKQQMLDGIMPIRNKMYDIENIDSFCESNANKLSAQEIDIVSQWKNAAFIDNGYIIKHLVGYSVIMDTENDNQLYGVKGITTPLPERYPTFTLPVIGEYILLPYKSYILYDGFICSKNIVFGSNIRRSLSNEYKHSKAEKGIYANYVVGDDLKNPPVIASVKDRIKYKITESLKYNRFPQYALSYAENIGSRQIFELEYSAHFLRTLRHNSKNRDEEIPKMHYAMYRENVIGVMPTKKELIKFCQTHYPAIFDYITMFKL